MSAPGTEAQLGISPYSSLLERKLFLSTAQSGIPQVPDIVAATIDKVCEGKTAFAKDLQRLKYQVLAAFSRNKQQSPDQNVEYICAAALAKQLLLSTEILSSDYNLIYDLWEIRLTMLVLAKDSYCQSIAKQEAKKLSSHLFKLTHLLHGDNRKVGFPANLPLSLELLIIRLRTNSPSFLCTSELYSLLWIIRDNISKNSENQSYVDSLTVILYLLSFNVSANLIAKREYLTFLTHADAMIKDLRARLEEVKDDKSYNTSLIATDQTLLAHYCILASLVSLIQGDYNTSEHYINKLADKKALSSLAPTEILQHVLTSINPILDNEEVLNLRPLGNPPKIDSWEDLLDLNKNTRITGRILCCYCSSVELLIRNNESFIDILHSAKQTPELLKSILSSTVYSGSGAQSDGNDTGAEDNAVKGDIEKDNEIGGGEEQKDNTSELKDKTEGSFDSITHAIMQDTEVKAVDILIYCWKLNIHKVYGFE